MSLHVFERISKRILRSCVLIRMMSSNRTGGLPSPSRISPCLILNSQLGQSMSSSAGSNVKVVSPWLMLRSDIESGGDMVYRFYSLEDKKVSWEGKIELEKNRRFVGSTYGWLASFNQSNCSLNLLDPLHGRKINLPAVGTVPDSDDWVSRVICSCSPDNEDCRALMIYGPNHRLAFCEPRRSHMWSPIYDGHRSVVVDANGKMLRCFSRKYDNFVYSKRRNTFFCITQVTYKYEMDSDMVVTELESLDLSEPDSARINCILGPEFDSPTFNDFHHDWPGRSEEESIFKTIECLHYKYLVVDEASDQLFLVVRHVLPRVCSDGSFRRSIFYSNYQGWDCSFAHKTVDFDVYKIDVDQKLVTHMNTCLDGLALFVGTNHPFAVRPTPLSELQPNSIYFTDLPDHISWYYSCHDNGVFDYESRTFSPCHPSCHIHLRSLKPTRRSTQEILYTPLPLWYTPESDSLTLL